MLGNPNSSKLLGTGHKAGTILSNKTNKLDKIRKTKLRIEEDIKDKIEGSKDKTEVVMVLEEGSTIMDPETMAVNTEVITKIEIKDLETKTEDQETIQHSIRTMILISKTDIEQ